MDEESLQIGADIKDPFMNYRLREARIEAGYTQFQLANKLKISINSVTSYERLRYHPSDEIAEKISKSLNKEVEELFPKKLKEIVKEINSHRKNRKKDALYHNTLTLNKRTKKRMMKSLYYEDPLNFLIEEEQESGLKNALEGLEDREQKIINRRYGLKNGGDRETLEQIGEQLNLTCERVRQIESAAIRKLWYELNNNPDYENYFFKCA